MHALAKLYVELHVESVVLSIESQLTVTFLQELIQYAVENGILDSTSHIIADKHNLMINTKIPQESIILMKSRSIEIEKNDWQLYT